MYEQVLWITGMPRSGSTWLSQIFASHPDVRLKFCPLFSYEFKNILNENSTADEVRKFLKEVYNTRSEYLDQEYLRKDGLIPTFTERFQKPSILTIKSTRFHNLTENFLRLCPEIKWIGIVRNPCASIYSWLSNPFEFPSEADPHTEWRTGSCRKKGAGEFWGFEDWKTVTLMFLDLEKRYPDRFKIIRHESLVSAPRENVRSLFSWLDVELHRQTEDFLNACHKVHVNHKRSVFKKPSSTELWRSELDPIIKDLIESEIAGTPLERFAEPVYWE